MPAPTPYYGGGTPYRASTTSAIPLDYFPRGRGNFVQVAGLGSVGLGALHGAGLGKLRGLRGTDALAPAAGTLGSLVGSGIAGGLTGYLASGKRAGAITGASFMAGVAMIAEAGGYFASDSKGSAAFVGLLGITGVGFAIHRFKR
jgi:hypothetical protein